MRELHLHLDGSLRPETLWDLAQASGRDLGDLNQVRDLMVAPMDCQSLNEYLERFNLPLEFMQRKDLIERMAFELVEDLANLGLEYAEIRFAPQLHTREGLSQEAVVEGAIQGVKAACEKYDSIKVGLILCAMRGDNNQGENEETLRLVREFLGDVVCAFDLAGAEALFPTKDFVPLFEMAQDLKVPYTIHAGEADGPESVWKALEMGAQRIGHGVRAIEDPALVRELADKKIPLEVCITSNYQTKLVDRLEDHPIKKLFEAGVRVTLNSDNMTVSNTDLVKEKEIAMDLLGLSQDQIDTMDQYAIEASFLK